MHPSLIKLDEKQECHLQNTPSSTRGNWASSNWFSKSRACFDFPVGGHLLCANAKQQVQQPKFDNRSQADAILKLFLADANNDAETDAPGKLLFKFQYVVSFPQLATVSVL